VAIRPPTGVIEVLAGLPRAPEPGVVWSAPAQWLVKLRPLGHVPDRLVEPLARALGEELDGAPPVPCVLGPATRRLGGQWLGAPVAGLDELASAVFDATAGLVPVTHPRPFQADVVIARGRVPAALAGQPVAACWTVDAVLLVADRSAPGRPRLDDLALFRLEPGPDRVSPARCPSSPVPRRSRPGGRLPGPG
jgi:2'-5' RNA ligase